MNDTTKTEYMRLGLGLAGVVANDMAAEIIWRVYEEIIKKGGDFSLIDASKIETLVKNKAARKAKPKKKISFEKDTTKQ